MKQVFLKSLPDGPKHAGQVVPENFGVREVEINEIGADGGFKQSELKTDQVIVRIKCLSVDPYMRNRMGGKGPGYMGSWAAGDTIESQCVGIVEASKCSKFPIGTLVKGMMPWNEFCVLDGSKPFPMGPMELPNLEGLHNQESLFLGIFGLTGVTAAIGLKVKGKMNEGDVVVVSGAAGATGSIAGQIARIKGASKVIGLCGTDEKCEFLKECGFTHMINYKTENIEEKLKEYCGNSVNCYFDNVGGTMSELIIGNMVENSNVVLCGQISSYNNKAIYPNVLSEKIQKHVENNKIGREPFLLLNWMPHYEPCMKQLIEWYFEKKLVNRETVINGLENAGVAFCNMMNGKNIGKQVVKLGGAKSSKF